MFYIEKKTKWQVLNTYNYSGTDYIIFVRKAVNSGMLYFKTKRITPINVISYNFNSNMFDIKKNLDSILSE